MLYVPDYSVATTRMRYGVTAYLASVRVIISGRRWQNAPVKRFWWRFSDISIYWTLNPCPYFYRYNPLYYQPVHTCTSTDRPRVISEGCTSLAFMGQFVEFPSDVVLTIETLARTPLQVMYQLTGLQNEIIEFYSAEYDIRYFQERIKNFAGVERSVTKKTCPKSTH